MKHTITETKIRSIVRKELQSYLIQEGLWDKFKGVVQNLPVAKQLSTLKNLGIDSNTLKSLAKTSIINPKDLAAQAKDAVDVATNTPEYREINTILSGINIGSTQLSQAYNLVYSKSKANKNVYTFAKIPQSEKSIIIEEYTKAYRPDSDLHTKLIEYFNLITKTQKNTIKSPMQERKINEAVDEISAKRQELIDYINKLYTTINSELEASKDSSKTYAIYLKQNLQTIFMFILQVLNELVKNPLQHQPEKIAKSIQELFAKMIQHLETLKQAQPAAEPAAEPAAAPTEAAAESETTEPAAATAST